MAGHDIDSWYEQLWPTVIAKRAIQPTLGLIVMWPASINHFVHPNLSNQSRVSICFNVMLDWSDDSMSPCGSEDASLLVIDLLAGPWVQTATERDPGVAFLPAWCCRSSTTIRKRRKNTNLDRAGHQ